jgi:hypothetical protein
MKRPIDTVRLLFGLAVALAILGAASAVMSNRFLLGDGGPFLIDVLRLGGYTHWDWARQYAHFITQAPVVAALALGVRSFYTLTMLYGVGLCGVPVLALMCAWALTPQKQSLALIWVASTIAFLQLNTGLFIISESHVMVGAFLALSCFLLFCHERPQPLGHLALALLITAVMVRSYESAALLAPPLVVLSASQLRRAQGSLRIALMVILVGLVAAVGVGFHFLFFAPGRNVHTVGLAHMLTVMFTDPNLLISTGAFGLFAVGMLRSRSDLAAPSARRVWMAVAVGAGVGMGALPLMVPAFIPAKFSYEARLLNIGVPFGVLMALMVHRRRQFSVNLLGIASYVFLVMWTGAWQMTTSFEWHQYAKELDRTAQEQTGMTVSLESTSFAKNPFNWGWTLPSQSIILQTLKGHSVRALVVDDPHPVYQPFDPAIRAQWPDLSAYGVKYAR